MARFSPRATAGRDRTPASCASRARRAMAARGRSAAERAEPGLSYAAELGARRLRGRRGGSRSRRRAHRSPCRGHPGRDASHRAGADDAAHGIRSRSQERVVEFAGASTIVGFGLLADGARRRRVRRRDRRSRLDDGPAQPDSLPSSASAFASARASSSAARAASLKAMNRTSSTSVGVERHVVMATRAAGSGG